VKRCLILLGRIPSAAQLEDPASVEPGTYLYDPTGASLARHAPVLIDHDPERVIGEVVELVESQSFDARWLAAQCLITDPPWRIRAGDGASFELYSQSSSPFGAGTVVFRFNVTEVTLTRSLRPTDHAARVDWISECQRAATRRAAPISPYEDDPWLLDAKEQASERGCILRVFPAQITVR
jgi:hypothetical protein